MATTTPAILRAVPLALILTVPTDSDPLDIAQEAADAVRELHREQSGERYAASGGPRPTHRSGYPSTFARSNSPPYLDGPPAPWSRPPRSSRPSP